MKCPHCNKDIADRLVISQAAAIQGRRSRRKLTTEQAQAMAVKSAATRKRSGKNDRGL